MSLGVTLHLFAIWVEVAVDQGRGQCSLFRRSYPEFVCADDTDCGFVL